MNEYSKYDIILLRHGESIGNAEARWQGQADYSLTEKGREQVRTLAERWSAEGREFDRIFCSPLKRANETADILSAALHSQLEIDPIWMERDIGAVAGMTADEVNQRLPRREFITPYAPIVGDEGEGDWALFLRGGLALHRLLSQAPGNYLVVSHGGLLNQVMYAVVGITPSANFSGPRFRFGNTGYAHVVYYPHAHRWQINAVNNRCHWKAKNLD